jgi:cell division protein FtsB
MSQHEGKLKNFFWSKWFLLMIFAAIVFVALACVRSYFQDYQVREEVARLQKEAADLESRKFATMDILKYVESNDFVEDKARTDFNLQKTGEQVAIIKKAGIIGQNDSGQVDNKVVELERISNPFKWWNFFTGSY